MGADSARFSAGVVTLSPPDHVGTMLTVHTSPGVLLPAGRWGGREFTTPSSD